MEKYELKKYRLKTLEGETLLQRISWRKRNDLAIPGVIISH